MSEGKKWETLPGIDEKYSRKVAYFCMEFAIDQALKIYSGGLGFLAGSHMRSACHLRQNLIGIGILWKYGYYDQERDDSRNMRTRFMKKYYNFLQETDIVVPVYINGHLVHVKALYLAPEIFNSAPIYLLTTDFDYNDHLARTITSRLYDSNEETRIAQQIVLGIGGAKVVEKLGGAEIYHMNEGHALPIAFELFDQQKSWGEVRKRLVFTTHTPEKAGNEEHNISLMDKMGYFATVPLDKVRKATDMHGQFFGLTPAALNLSKRANGVSKLHGTVAKGMWSEYKGACEIIPITNAQDKKYWMDGKMQKAFDENDIEALKKRKHELKLHLFSEVADQCGKLFNPDHLTVVWARRIAGYKRADLIIRDISRFLRLVNNEERPVQVIWAGKPYPEDENAISIFNHLASFTYKKPNCAVVFGYELRLSRKLKEGADVWLNTPRRPREASGTSGMTAAMNGALNVSTADGWIPEFAKDGENSFILPEADLSLPIVEQDNFDSVNLYDILESRVVPVYYDQPDEWWRMVMNSMADVTPAFDSDRMADDYYRELYDY